MGFCLRVIVNEKLLNLEKTTSSALSVLLLIYEFDSDLKSLTKKTDLPKSNDKIKL